ncbi:MAG: S8 family serine peptidase [Actinomycetaceae bacterium]|nr:S8 family serine peptidase [Actinomycetaceae bacterium]
MKHIPRIVAGVSAATLLFTPGLAQAAPEATPADSTPAVTAPVEYTKVLIMLDNQPTRPGAELLNLREVNKLRDRLVEKYGIKPDRSFGYLVKGFAAQIPTQKWAEIAAEPGVGSIERTREYQPLMGTASDLTFSTQARETHNVSGEGVVVAVIDTGIDMHHQDMRLDDGAKTKLTPAPGFTPKVPWGYNYADDNTEVKAINSSEHGMHVAGIVGANGGAGSSPATNGRINGVAPNAQILAMKVFSSSPAKGQGASTEDIIAAIEDSVKHKADIINMSLGSANGFSSPTEGEQRAVQIATDSGVEVVVAAGNDGLNFSPTGGTDDLLGMFDDGPHGSPASAPSALSVASVDNQASIVRGAKAVQGTNTVTFGYDVQVGAADGQAHKIVYGGLGKPGEVPDTAAGNYVLIQRGDIPFSDKFAEAIKKGAVGVIIYNHAQGGDTFVGMAGVDKFTVFGASLTHSDGERLRQMIATGDTSITFSNDLISQAAATAKTPSSFTSWGTTPSLDFKPQISGIGGLVWSTVNDNQYENQSGTSMAAPHVAGATALLVQKGREKYPDLSAAQLHQQNRVSFVNTAQILEHTAGVPFSPRQMGAGLINTKAALETDVFATVSGSPWVALKEVAPGETFTVTLENKGTVDRTYNTGSTCVINETNQAGKATTTACNANEAITASAATVNVPAGGTATVDFTVQTDPTSTHWLGAWVKFTSADPKVPALSLPVLGFVGDWNAEPIIDAPVGSPSVFDPFYRDPAENTMRTRLVSNVGSLYKVVSNGATFWISPNGDGVRDNVSAMVMQLRNAEEIRGSILDNAGQTLRELGVEHHLPRFHMKHYVAGETNLANELSALNFDGTVYNQKTGAFENLPEGDYVYRLAAKLGPEWPAQNTDFNVKVDLTKPEITSVEYLDAPDGKKVEVTATDSGSGVDSVILKVNGGFSELEAQYLADKWVVLVPQDVVDYMDSFVIEVTDEAGNTASTDNPSEISPVRIDASDEWEEVIVGAGAESDFYAEPTVKDGVRRLSGTVSDTVTRLTVNDQEVAITGGKFATTVPVKQGEQTVVIRAEGPVAYEREYTFTYDSEAPVLNITSGATLDAASGLYLLERNGAGKVVFAGTASDNLVDLEEVSVNLVGAPGSKQVEVNNNSFNVEIAVPEHVGIIQLTVSDGVNETEAYIRVTNSQFDPTGNLTFGSLKTANNNLVDIHDENVVRVNGKYYFKWQGLLSSIPGSFQANGEDVVFDPTTGAFLHLIELQQGITVVNVKLTNKGGQVVHDTSLNIFFDSVIPVYTLEDGKPALHADGALYLKEAGDVQFKGTVSDNAFGYALALNGNVLENILTIFDPKAEVNQRDFDTTVKVADGDLLLLGLYDQAGNFTERKIPVIVDNTKPELEVSGIAEGDTYKVTAADAKVTKQLRVRTTDPNLAGLKVSVDGDPVATRVVKATAHPKASLVQEGDIVAGQRVGDGQAPEDPKFQGNTGGLEENAVATVNSADETSQDALNKVTEIAKARVAQANADAAVAAAPAETEFDVTVEVEVGVGQHFVVAEVVDKATNSSVQLFNFEVALEAPKVVETELTAKAQAQGAELSAVGKAAEGTTFKLTAEENANTVTFTAVSAPVTFPAQYTLTVNKKLLTVKHVAEGGKETLITPVEEGGKYSFTAPSNGKIVVTVEADVNAGGNTDGSQQPQPGKPIAPKKPGTPGQGKDVQQPGKPGAANKALPNSGSDALSYTLLSLTLLAAGLVFVATKKRRS